MNIDVHAHYIPIGSLEMAARIGAPYGLTVQTTEQDRTVLLRDGKPFLTQAKAQFSDLDLRLSIMDGQGIDMQVLSPAGSYFFYWMGMADSLEYARWLNDRLSDAVAKFPRRFVALASVPLQNPVQAAAELQRAVSRQGFRGAEIASNINGRYLDDPALEPFWQTAQALDTVIFIHPNQVVGAELMKSYNLANLVGNPTDTSLTVTKLIFGGVLERFPRLKLLLAHGGGFLPYTWGRLDRGYAIQDSSKRTISKPPSDYVNLLYFDTITHSPMALEYLIGHFGAERVLLGSDYPYGMGDPEPLTSLSKSNLDREQFRHVSGVNACKLFHIDS
jgi:aminocarboxymuconate-semialdehyde decarboxylase